MESIRIILSTHLDDHPDTICVFVELYPLKLFSIPNSLNTISLSSVLRGLCVFTIGKCTSGPLSRVQNRS